MMPSRPVTRHAMRPPAGQQGRLEPEFQRPLAHEAPPARAQPALHRVRDVLHLADAKHGRADEECAGPDDDDAGERARLRPEALHRPAGEEVVIAEPADAGEHGAGQREAREEPEHGVRLEPSQMPVHQHVEQQEVGGRDAGGRERESLMSPAQPHGEQPVEEEIERRPRRSSRTSASCAGRWHRRRGREP